jgi:hypothetical protein
MIMDFAPTTAALDTNKDGIGSAPAANDTHLFIDANLFCATNDDA